MTKTVALSEDAYGSLAQCKEGDESFSDVVLRITKGKQKCISQFFGAWKDDTETAKIYDQILKKSNWFINS